jgi:hypothetical protein
MGTLSSARGCGIAGIGGSTVEPEIDFVCTIEFWAFKFKDTIITKKKTSKILFIVCLFFVFNSLCIIP